MGKRTEPQTRRSLSIEGVPYDLAARLAALDECSIPQLVTRLIESEARARDVAKTPLVDIEARRRQSRVAKQPAPKPAKAVKAPRPAKVSKSPRDPFMDGIMDGAVLTPAPPSAVPPDAPPEPEIVVREEPSAGPRAKPLPAEVPPVTGTDEARGGGIVEF